MSDPQEAATPSDPHSAEAEERYPEDLTGLGRDWDAIRQQTAFVAGRVSRDAEVAELREAYESWKSSGRAMHSALLEIWHSVTAWDTSDMTFGDDPQSVVKAVRESVSAEVAELKAKIAAAVARLNAASIPPMMTEAQFNATTITDARRILLGSASSPVEGGN